ncbi:MAG TPA: N-acetylmuramic acid 6-phosphate etherase [Chloroflexi bacterium]|nr:N-acetylmuramic acid 6-phosphate etherase [Chloroflexota bacterium]
MSFFVIGVDGGGSKTEAVILDARGKVLGRGRSGPSNHHLVGEEGARAALEAAMRAAAEAAGAPLSQAAAVVWALAGAGRPAEAQRLHDMQAALFPGVPGQVVDDAAAALVGGVGRRQGVVVIAGTGAIVYGEDTAGNTARSGGWGHLLDEGSGYALGLWACRAVARAADGSELPTRLTDRLLQALALPSATQLIPWLYDARRGVAEMAALAPLVLEEAERGDLIATDGVLRAADALAEGVGAVARRLGWSDAEPFPVVLTGGLLSRSAFYRSVVAQAVQTRVPAARPRRPLADAAVGAGWLALALAGRPWPRHAASQAPSGGGPWTSEQRHVLTHDLDTRTTLEMVGLMHLEDRRAVAAVRLQLPAIAQAVEAIAARMKQGGRLIYIGAGTSGRLGVLDAAECPPTFNTKPGQVVGVIAGGRAALTEAVEEAEDSLENGIRAIRDLEAGPLDSVVGIAASGRTPYVLGALTEARQRGALTVALICNLPAPLAEVAEHVLAPLVGPEVIAGSTRLKAGTVQKLVLNMLSTGVMVRLGKTYGNLMVDVQQHNAKLQERARRIVAQACGVSLAEAAEALARCDRDVKVAIVSTMLHCSPKQAREHLRRAGGNVRQAIAAARKEGNEEPAALKH